MCTASTTAGAAAFCSCASHARAAAAMPIDTWELAEMFDEGDCSYLDSLQHSLW
jgi:hypothetical protein